MDQTGSVLSFHLFGIPVVVRPSFLIVAAVIGLTATRNHISLVLAWVGVVFVSILVHELGHALTARAFGSRVEIELNAVGGLTSWTVPADEFGPGRRAMVAAAGSAVGVLFGGIMWLIDTAVGPFAGITDFIVTSLIFVNVFWGLLNWLPIRPLDGGHLLESILQKLAPRKGERIANVVFFMAAGVAFGLSLYLSRFLITLLTGWLLWGEISRGLPRGQPTPVPPMSFDDPPPEVGAEVEPEPEEADG